MGNEAFISWLYVLWKEKSSGDVERWISFCESCSWEFELETLFPVLGHGHLLRKWFPSSLLGMRDVRRDKSRLEQSVSTDVLPGWTLTCVPIYQCLVYSTNKDLFHSLEDHALFMSALLPIFFFPPSIKIVQIESGKVGGWCHEKIKLEMVLLK